jgi:adenine/guanine phosphoribosyltransferase-like PRPP-binding protein
MTPRAFWAELLPSGSVPDGPPFRGGYPARMPDGRILWQPIRPVADPPGHAVASLQSTHASFAVVRALAGWIADAVRELGCDAVVGVPALGYPLAMGTAEAMGLPDWIPLGYSRKPWFDEALSAPVASSTSVGGAKRLWLDPNLRPRLAGRRLLVVDDVVSTGTSAAAALALLEAAGRPAAAFAAAMSQTARWVGRLPAGLPAAAAFRTPLLRLDGDAAWPVPGTLADVLLPRGGDG